MIVKYSSLMNKCLQRLSILSPSPMGFTIFFRVQLRYPNSPEYQVHKNGSGFLNTNQCLKWKIIKSHYTSHQRKGTTGIFMACSRFLSLIHYISPIRIKPPRYSHKTFDLPKIKILLTDYTYLASYSRTFLGFQLLCLLK